eukprot:gene8981-1611_t
MLTGKNFTKMRVLQANSSSPDADPSVVLEVGCGNGSTVLPLLQGMGNCRVVATDFSSRALEVTRSNVIAIDVGGKLMERLRLLRWDPSIPADGPDHPQLPVAPGSAHFVTMMFVLGAVKLDHMATTLENCRRCLKTTGQVLFRDYGLCDLTQ